MVDHTMEFRLSGTGVPDGEIGMGELAAIAAALQELATRIGRFSVDQRGPGPSKGAVEALTRLRLTGLSDGSTKIHVAYGQHDVLDIDLDLERETQSRFIGVIEGLALGQRPNWVPDLVAESALKLVNAFERCATAVHFTAPHAENVRIEPQSAPRKPWRNARVPGDEVSVVGRLEAVDLRDRRFRIRDDVGNAIGLEHVVDAERAAPLISRRVRAVGVALLGGNGKLKSLREPILEDAPLPEAWMPGESVDWSSELAKSGPQIGAGPDLTEEEFADFLASIKG